MTLNLAPFGCWALRDKAAQRWLALRYAAMKARFLASLLFISATAIAGEPREVPPLPFHDWGACPFECCTYREWIAKAPITVFKKRDEKDVAFQLSKNEHVLAITGVVVTHKPGITEILKPIQIGYLPNGKKKVLSLKPGEKIYSLHYAGEGNDVFWYKGKTYIDEVSVPDNGLGHIPNMNNIAIHSRPEFVWWAKIRNKAGETGWTRKTNLFGNQDACD